jgi:hypothetical protein
MASNLTCFCTCRLHSYNTYPSDVIFRRLTTIVQINLRMSIYEGVSKSFWTGCLERELQMVQLSATRCSCIAILWVSLLSFAAVTLCVASQRVFVVVYFVIDSVRKLLDTPPVYASKLLYNIIASLPRLLFCKYTISTFILWRLMAVKVVKA